VYSIIGFIHQIKDFFSRLLWHLTKKIGRFGEKILHDPKKLEIWGAFKLKDMWYCPYSRNGGSKKIGDNTINFTHIDTIDLSFLIVRKREKLLINLPSFVDISMQINFGSFNGCMSKIFLYYFEVF